MTAFHSGRAPSSTSPARRGRRPAITSGRNSGLSSSSSEEDAATPGSGSWIVAGKPESSSSAGGAAARGIFGWKQWDTHRNHHAPRDAIAPLTAGTGSGRNGEVSADAQAAATLTETRPAGTVSRVCDSKGLAGALPSAFSGRTLWKVTSNDVAVTTAEA